MSSPSALRSPSLLRIGRIRRIERACKSHASSSRSVSSGRLLLDHGTCACRKSIACASTKDNREWTEKVVQFFDNPGDNAAITLKDIFSLTTDTAQFSARGRLVRLAVILFGVANAIGLCWFGIAYLEGFPEDNSWVEQIKGNGSIGSLNEYAAVFYWGFVLMSGFGPDINPPVTPLETSFMIVAQLLAITAYTTLLGNLVSLFEELRMAEAQFQARMFDLSIWCEENDLSDKLKRKIFEYERQAYQRGIKKASLSVLDGLPSHLMNEIVSQMGLSVITQVPLFADADAGFQLAMLRICKPELCLRGDYLIKQGEIGQEMYFIKSGKLDVLVNGQKVAEKVGGDYVGEISVVFAQARTASVVAAEDTELFSISKRDFEELRAIEEYKATFDMIKETAKKVINENLQRSTASMMSLESLEDDDAVLEQQSAAAVLISFLEYLHENSGRQLPIEISVIDRNQKLVKGKMDVFDPVSCKCKTFEDVLLQQELQRTLTKSANQLLEFDSFRFDSLSCGRPLTLLAFFLFERWNLQKGMRISRKKVLNFFFSVDSCMQFASYHNAVHVTDVLQLFCGLLFLGGISHHIEKKHLLLSAFLATIVHDFGHPGVNNMFLSSAGSELVDKYGDKSTLERFHVDSAWKILFQEQNFFLDVLTPGELEEVRQNILELVISTDMALHSQLLGQFEDLLQRFPDGISQSTKLTAEDQMLVLKLVLKCSDLGHLGRPYSIHLRWIGALAEEFWQQGDIEKSMGIQVGALNQRGKDTLSEIQPDFYSSTGIPLFDQLARLFPKTKELSEEAQINCRLWEVRIRDSSTKTADISSAQQ